MIIETNIGENAPHPKSLDTAQSPVTDLGVSDQAESMKWEIDCIDDYDPEADLNHVETILDGYGSLLSKEVAPDMQITGNEAYAKGALSIYGAEDWVENLKKGAETAYKAIIETLKKIKDFFFGDGAKRVEEADARANESLQAMGKLDLDAPIKEESKLTNPLSYLKGIQESVDLEKVYEKYPSVKTAMENITSSIERVKESKTVGQLGAVFQDARKKAATAGTTISDTLKKAVTEAEKKANEMRSPKTAQDDSNKEVQAALKEEHKETTNEAKEQVKESKVLAGLQNKIVSLLNAIGTNAGNVKGEQEPSKFKG
jgi:uncharacterized protein YukE